MLKQDEFIEFEPLSRTITFDLLSLDPEVEHLEYSVKVYNKTSQTSMTYPLRVFIERQEEVQELQLPVFDFIVQNQEDEPIQNET